MERLVSFLGLMGLIGIAWLMSSDRKAVNWRLVGWGVALQIIFALLIFNPVGEAVFRWCNDFIIGLLDFTRAGAGFVFNDLADGSKGFNFTFQIMPTIIFFSSLMAILYYYGIMQKVVYLFAVIMERTMKTSGAETLAASANIFVGQTEAPLAVKPYIEKMTMSELMAIMVGGFANTAGGVLAAYVGMLSGLVPNIAGHLLACSIMSAPASLVIAKIMIPETTEPETAGKMHFDMEQIDQNAIDAAARGASEGMQLSINVVGMLIAFLALLAMANSFFGVVGDMMNWGLRGVSNSRLSSAALNAEALQKISAGGDKLIIKLDEAGEYSGKEFKISPTHLTVGAVTLPSPLPEPKLGSNEMGVFPPKMSHLTGQKFSIRAEGEGQPILFSAADLEVKTGVRLSIQLILGWLFAPFALLMGVAWKDCFIVGNFLGEKIILTEFIAYDHLGHFLKNFPGVLDQRSAIIASYALCGFANFGSIGIQLGGIGAMAPSRRGDLAKIGFLAMVGGSLATFMTATVAGMFKL